MKKRDQHRHTVHDKSPGDICDTDTLRRIPTHTHTAQNDMK